MSRTVNAAQMRLVGEGGEEELNLPSLMEVPIYHLLVLLFTTTLPRC